MAVHATMTSQLPALPLFEQKRLEDAGVGRGCDSGQALPTAQLSCGVRNPPGEVKCWVLNDPEPGIPALQGDRWGFVP